MIFPLCIVAVCPGPLGADAAPLQLDIAALLQLAHEPWRNEESFREALIETVPNFSERRGLSRLAVPHNDPFLYNISGHFAEPPSPHLPGGVLRCSRYGLETRDLFDTEGFTAPAAFALYQEAEPAPDDAALWPETAIARLTCSFVWDDSRAVEIIPFAQAEFGLSAVFADIRVERDLARFGAEGYRLTGLEADESSSVWLESAEITLTPSFQSLRFRAYLLNGGM